MTQKKLTSLQEVEEQVAARINDFNKKRHSLKLIRQRLIITQAILSSATTVLVAINAKLNFDTLAFFAIAVSAISSLAGLFLSQFMFHERLISQISTLCSLRELQSTIKIRKAMELDDGDKYKISLEDVESYFDKLQNILNIANNEWQKLAKNNKPKKD